MDMKGKNFLVIGGGGFIGSHTVDKLLTEDIGEVVIYDNFFRGSEENLANALKDPRVKIFEAGGDILHSDILNQAMTKKDGVFHFAALWLLQCQEFPRSAFDVNIRGTFNVMEACLNQGVERLVYSSSASVYGDAVREPMDEDHPYNNKNFYGATKIAGEAMMTAYHHQYGLNYVGLRYMNVYGPRQDYHGAYIAVIMKMLDAIDKNESPTILGNGTESFDFVAVEDCAYANLCAMKSDALDKNYNVGTGVRTSLKELAEKIISQTNCDKQIKYEKSNSNTLVKNRICDPKLAIEDLGYKFQINLDEGLRRLIDWRTSHKEEVMARRRSIGLEN